MFQVNGTIWTELDETKLYQVIDLAEIDRLFSAYQKNGLLVSFLHENLSNIFFEEICFQIVLCRLLMLNLFKNLDGWLINRRSEKSW